MYLLLFTRHVLFSRIVILFDSILTKQLFVFLFTTVFLFKNCPGQFLLTSQGQVSHKNKADNFHTRQITDFA